MSSIMTAFFIAAERFRTMFLIVLGDNGFLAGFLGSRDIVCECKNCGFEWKVEE